MLSRRIAVGTLAVALAATPAVAQHRGMLEFGAFGSYHNLDDRIPVDNGAGFGGWAGIYLERWLQVVASGSYSDVEEQLPVTNGFTYQPLYGHLVVSPLSIRNVSLYAGAGVVRASYKSTYNWGSSGVVGVRVPVAPFAAIRVEGLMDHMPTPAVADDQDWNSSLRAGLSFFRPASMRTQTIERIVRVTDTVQMPTTNVTSDADRLRILALEDSLRQLRDELSTRTSNTGTASGAAGVLAARIYFDFDRSAIRSDAAATLEEKLPIFQANPQLRIRIVGHADERGSDEYNLALSQRRALAAKRWLVSRGIAANRIDVGGMGEERPVVPNATNEADHQQNRRDEFEIIAGGENLR